MSGEKLKREVATLSITSVDMQQLEEIAKKHNCLWGDKPNVSELMRQIASGRLTVIDKSRQLSQQEKFSKAIEKCFSALIEIQQIMFGGD